MDFQRWLDEWADCILPGDYDTFRLFNTLPFAMATPNGQWSITDEAAYRSGFDAYRDFLLNIGANMIVRTLREAMPASDTTCDLTYENSIMRNAQRVLAPSWARARLVFSDGRWRASGITEIHTDETHSSPLPVLETQNLHRSHMRNRRV